MTVVRMTARNWAFYLNNCHLTLGILMPNLIAQRFSIQFFVRDGVLDSLWLTKEEWDMRLESKV